MEFSEERVWLFCVYLKLDGSDPIVLRCPIEIYGSFEELQCSFEELQGSFMEIQGSFEELQGSFVKIQGSFEEPCTGLFAEIEVSFVDVCGTDFLGSFVQIQGPFADFTALWVYTLILIAAI